MNSWCRLGLRQSAGGVERGVPNISFSWRAQSGMTSFVTFVFFCSSLICNGLDRPWDAVSGRQLNVRLIFEQKWL